MYIFQCHGMKSHTWNQAKNEILQKKANTQFKKNNKSNKLNKAHKSWYKFTQPERKACEIFENWSGSSVNIYI